MVVEPVAEAEVAAKVRYVAKAEPAGRRSPEWPWLLSGQLVRLDWLSLCRAPRPLQPLLLALGAVAWRRWAGSFTAAPLVACRVQGDTDSWSDSVG